MKLTLRSPTLEGVSQETRLKTSENSTLHAKIPLANFTEILNATDLFEDVTQILKNITDISSNFLSESSNTTEPSSSEGLYFEIFLIIGLFLLL